MTGLGEGLTALLTASVLCAVAESLMPDGPVKRVGRLVCGLVLVCVVLAPVSSLDLTGGQRWLENYLEQIRHEEQTLKERVSGEMKDIIEGEYAAYIADKAAELGVTCRAEVICRAGEEGLWMPHSARVTGVPEGRERERLAALIWADLTIPPERLTFLDGEDGS